MLSEGSGGYEVVVTGVLVKGKAGVSKSEASKASAWVCVRVAKLEQRVLWLSRAFFAVGPGDVCVLRVNERLFEVCC